VSRASDWLIEYDVPDTLHPTPITTPHSIPSYIVSELESLHIPRLSFVKMTTTSRCYRKLEVSIVEP
jgi:hypothetical protein